MSDVTSPVVTSNKQIEESAMTLAECAEKLSSATDVLRMRDLLLKMKEELNRSEQLLTSVEDGMREEFNAHVISQATTQATGLGLSLAEYVAILKPETATESKAENPPAKAAASETSRKAKGKPKAPFDRVLKKEHNNGVINFSLGYYKRYGFKPFSKLAKDFFAKHGMTLTKDHFQDVTEAEYAELLKQAADNAQNTGAASPK